MSEGPCSGAGRKMMLVNGKSDEKNEGLCAGMMMHPCNGNAPGFIERRRHPRFAVDSIYCSDSRKNLYKINDLSLGGLSFLNFEKPLQLPHRCSVHLFLGGNAFAIRDIDCLLVSCRSTHDCHRLGMKFAGLSKKQHENLYYFLLAGRHDLPLPL